MPKIRPNSEPRTDPPLPVIDLDRDLGNADWTKTGWDLPAENVEELRRWLKSSGKTAAQFKRLSTDGSGALDATARSLARETEDELPDT